MHLKICSLCSFEKMMQNESIFGRFKHREKQGFDEVHTTSPFTLDNKNLSWQKMKKN